MGKLRLRTGPSLATIAREKWTEKARDTPPSAIANDQAKQDEEKTKLKNDIDQLRKAHEARRKRNEINDEVTGARKVAPAIAKDQAKQDGKKKKLKNEIDQLRQVHKDGRKQNKKMKKEVMGGGKVKKGAGKLSPRKRKKNKTSGKSKEAEKKQEKGTAGAGSKFPCDVPGCPRWGDRGFRTKDALFQHKSMHPKVLLRKGNSHANPDKQEKKQKLSSNELDKSSSSSSSASSEWPTPSFHHEGMTVNKKNSQKPSPSAASSVITPGRVFVRNLPEKVTEADILALFGQAGRVAWCFIMPKHSAAIAKFVTTEDAAIAIERFDGFMWKGETLEVLPAKGKRDKIDQAKVKVKREAKTNKRLIMRNLVFWTNETHIRKFFEPLETLEDVKIPPRKDGREGNAGYAFVQFARKEDALRAVKEFSGNLLLRREVAIDWAVSKDVYSTLQGKQRLYDFGWHEDRIGCSFLSLFGLTSFMLMLISLKKVFGVRKPWQESQQLLMLT